MKKLYQCQIYSPTIHCLKMTTKQQESFNLFAVKVKKLSLYRKLVAVTTNSIVQKAVHVPIKYSQYDITVLFLIILNIINN